MNPKLLFHPRTAFKKTTGFPGFLTSVFVLVIAGLLGCKSTAPKPEPKPEPQSETATFGAGCYWCSEAIFQRVTGVRKVTPGFMGQDPSATYAQVAGEKTDYAEVCQVVFNPEEVTYTQLLEIFFQVHDPTSVNRQGEDSGPLYRSVLFFHNTNQLETAKKVIQSLDESNVFEKKIVTDIEPAGTLISAKEKEFNYFNKNRENKHCQTVILPKIEKFQQTFQSLYQEPTTSQ